MTNAKLAKHPNEGRSKIGPWDIDELRDMVAALDEVQKAAHRLTRLGTTKDVETIAPGVVDAGVEQIRDAARELTKALGAFASAESPEVARELAAAFSEQRAAVHPTEPRATSRVDPPILCSLMSTESCIKHGRQVDVALIAVCFYEPGMRGSRHEYTDAVLVRRDRETNERRIRHFTHEPNDLHFQRAIHCRLDWLGVSEGPLVGEPAKLVGGS